MQVVFGDRSCLHKLCLGSPTNWETAVPLWEGLWSRATALSLVGYIHLGRVKWEVPASHGMRQNMPSRTATGGMFAADMVLWVHLSLIVKVGFHFKAHDIYSHAPSLNYYAIILIWFILTCVICSAIVCSSNCYQQIFLGHIAICHQNLDAQSEAMASAQAKVINIHMDIFITNSNIHAIASVLWSWV